MTEWKVESARSGCIISIELQADYFSVAKTAMLPDINMSMTRGVNAHSRTSNRSGRSSQGGRIAV